MITSFVPGSTWELTINANCIPAGRYTFVEERGEFLLFSVGKKIQFGITAAYYKPFLKPISGDDMLCKTRSRQFIKEYARLFFNTEIQSSAPHAMTFCAMAPSVSRKLKSMVILQNTLNAPPVIH